MVVGQRIRIAEDKTDTIYVVRGTDPVSGRIWLCVDDLRYEGYDGDLIVLPKTVWPKTELFNVVLADGRSALPTTISVGEWVGPVGFHSGI